MHPRSRSRLKTTAAGLPADSNGLGFGLIGMRERVELRGGELTVEPVPHGGTRVKATLPVERIEP